MIETENSLCLQKSAKRAAGRSSLSVLVALAAGYLVVSLSSAVFAFLPLTPKGLSNATMISNMIGIDLVGIPLGYLLLRSLPRAQVEKEPFRFKTFLQFLPCCFALGVAGAMISTLISSFLPSGLNDTVTEFLEGSGIAVSAVSVVIAAPIAEELLFRKWIIDRLEGYSPIGSVLFSAILFGLFHHNFSQLFYAFLLGFFFGSVYQRTHNILYTILLHVVFNSFSVIMVALSSVLEPYGEIMIGAASAMFGLVEFTLAALGVVFLIVFRSKWFPKRDKAKENGKAFYRSVWFYILLSVCLLLSVLVEVLSSVPSI